MANANQKKLIEDEKVKYITFSKRRSGIFKKASELCTLCAVEMAIIIFSPAGKPYSFGNHSLNATIDSFTHSANSDARATGEDGPPQQRVVLGDLYKQHSDLLAHLNAEKKRGKSLQKMASFPDIDKMNGDELLDLKSSMEDLKQKVLNRKKELLAKRPLDLTLTLGGIYSSGDVSSPTKYQPTWLDSSISVHNGDDSY